MYFGVQVDVICKLGVVSDYYNLIYRHNINNYFLCKVESFGEKNLTQDEIESEIVGMVHTEEPWDYFIQVSQNYKNLEKEMIKHIMCDVRSKTPERRSIVLTADERDIQRVELLESLGGKKTS